MIHKAIYYFPNIFHSGCAIADYIWWTGEGPPPKERYVEVGFHDGNDVLPVRRTQLSEADPSAMDAEFPDGFLVIDGRNGVGKKHDL
jgi:hypothetical protein